MVCTFQKIQLFLREIDRDLLTFLKEAMLAVCLQFGPVHGPRAKKGSGESETKKKMLPQVEVKKAASKTSAKSIKHSTSVTEETVEEFVLEMVSTSYSAVVLFTFLINVTAVCLHFAENGEKKRWPA